MKLAEHFLSAVAPAALVLTRHAGKSGVRRTPWTSPLSSTRHTTSHLPWPN